jgi:hypothetical protein
MDPQIIATPQVGPKLFTRVKTFWHLIDLQVPSEFACLRRPSHQRDNLVLGDVWRVFVKIETESTENDGVSMLLQKLACCTQTTTLWFGALKPLR